MEKRIINAKNGITRIDVDGWYSDKEAKMLEENGINTILKICYNELTDEINYASVMPIITNDNKFFIKKILLDVINSIDSSMESDY